ncbi:POK8 protein, partial [Penelope pileata]|nr:POK8 protein [Penelope pileata]
CIPLRPESQKLFALEWENPQSGRKIQLAWTVLPQGFKNSPTIFETQLVKDLEQWERPKGKGTVLQYVDDILVATKTREQCLTWTISLLNYLGTVGYRVSHSKAQIGHQQVTYLEFELSGGERTLGQERKEAICQTP